MTYYIILHYIALLIILHYIPLHLCSGFISSVGTTNLNGDSEASWPTKDCLVSVYYFIPPPFFLSCCVFLFYFSNFSSIGEKEIDTVEPRGFVDLLFSTDAGTLCWRNGMKERRGRTIQFA